MYGIGDVGWFEEYKDSSPWEPKKQPTCMWVMQSGAWHPSQQQDSALPTLLCSCDLDAVAHRYLAILTLLPSHLALD